MASFYVFYLYVILPSNIVGYASQAINIASDFGDNTLYVKICEAVFCEDLFCEALFYEEFFFQQIIFAKKQKNMLTLIN